MINVAVIGLGHWGPNLVRNLSNPPESEVTIVCDSDCECMDRVCNRFPSAKGHLSCEDVFNADLDAVAIATPTKTHYSLAKMALERGLHTFVEKPLATSTKECQELIELAKENNLILFVGHVFLYNSAVIKLKELIDSGELGNICYISSTRLNLGPVRRDVNALWDLAPHDISIILYLMGRLPISVNCQGLAYLDRNVHDVCLLTSHFHDGTMASIHSSWIDPNKERRMAIVGEKKMVVYDDIEPVDKIKIYDKSVEKPLDYETFGEFHFSYRYGDTHIPRLDHVEPLKAECQHFIDCIKQREIPRTDGQNGWEVVRVLEAADISLKNDGGKVMLSSEAAEINLLKKSA